MKEWLEKWAVGLLTAATLSVATTAVSLWLAVRSLQQYHSQEWPLEKQLMLAEHAQLEVRIGVNERRLEAAEARSAALELQLARLRQ